MWRPVVVCVLTMLAPAAAAQVFECIDARGVKQYTQFCPPGTVQQRAIIKGSESSGEAGAANPAGAGGAAPKSIEAREVEFRKRMLERQDAEIKAAQEKSQADEYERNCIEARSQLKAVVDGERMERTDAVTGERTRLGDEERAEEADRQRKAIAQWCK